MEARMKNMIRYAAVLFVFMSINLLAQSDMSNLKSTFQQLEDKWSQALVSGDLTALADMYTNEAYSLPNNMSMLKGRSAILEGHKKELQDVKFISTSSKTLDVKGNGNIAVEIGTYTSTFTPANSTEQKTEDGKYVNVWQKQSDGSWKILTDSWNTDVDPNMIQAGAKSKDNENK
jgi:uncharacterized protein (TIGR02246 family)